MNPLELINVIYKHKLEYILLGVRVALRIFLIITITVASAERYFSNLKRDQNYLRSTMPLDILSKIDH